MKNLGKLIALLLAVCVVGVSLTGCFASFDAALYVKGNIDSSYLGVFDKKFLDIIVDTEESLKENYEDNLVIEAEYFLYYFEIEEENVPGIKSEVAEMLREIYSKAKYEVGKATKAGNSYLVSVTIYPIDIISKVVEEDFDEAFGDWERRGELGEFDDMADEEIEMLWARIIIDLVKARLGNIGYLEPETISVQVVVESSNRSEVLYIISENDLSRIDQLILAY